MGRNTFLHGYTVLMVLFLRRELAQLRMQGGAATQAQGAQAAEQVAALEARAACAEADAITLRERLDQASGEHAASGILCVCVCSVDFETSRSHGRFYFAAVASFLM